MFHSSGRLAVRVSLALLLVLSSVTRVADAAAVFTVTGTFADDDAFSLAELSARLEAGAAPNAGVVLRADCIQRLLSPSFACDGVGTEALCVVAGVYINVSLVTFSCDAARGCPSDDDTLNTTLQAAVPTDGCGLRSVSGFINTCYPSAWCQWTQETNLTSFGSYCPSAQGSSCCASGSVAADTAFPGGFLSSGSTVDYLTEMSHVADLSFRVSFDVSPPSLVRVNIETPYVTSASTMTSISNGVVRQTKMCPSAYLFGLQDPVETLPPERDGQYRRTSVQDSWLPLTYLPVQDLIGKPRSACGNYDFTYTSDGDFRSKFNFPDLVTNGIPYGPTPKSDSSVWNVSVGPRNIPSKDENWWTIGTPDAGRVNYTMGFWDLVTGFYQCRDYATGRRLVDRRVEPEFAYYMGVPYRIETYSWRMHLCQVGFYGAKCEDTTRTRVYAKTCAQIPVSFTVAPQQVSTVLTDLTSSSLLTKTFLQSVESISSNCAAGEERIAITVHLSIFDPQLVISEESVHDVRPSVLFETKSHDNLEIYDASSFTTPNEFLSSKPTSEGIFMLQTSSVSTWDGEVTNRKMVLLTKCFFTGLDSRRRVRSDPDTFADVMSSGSNTAQLDIDIVLRRTGVTLDVRNTIHARILATKETFVLRKEIVLEGGSTQAEHRLYGSYESARDDIGIVPNAFPEGALMNGGDQVCSKHLMHGSHATSVALRPNTIGACLISQKGLSRVDGEGIRLAGREILYHAYGMPEPKSHTFGCQKTWIDVQNKTMNAEGVYELGRLQYLPDENHERVYWLVTMATPNEQAFGTPGQSLSDVFGVGMFHYDDQTNTQRVHKAHTMQTDPTTDAMGNDELVPGCVETQGNLKASCNLVCWTLVDSLLTGDVGENKTLMVHHISIVTLANETQTEWDDRFQTRRKLSQVEQSVTRREQEQARLFTVRSKPVHVQTNDAPPTPGHTHGTQTTEGLSLRELVVGLIIAFSVVICMLFCACACYFMSHFSIRLKKRKRRHNAPLRLE